MRNFIIFFQEKEGSSPIIRLLDQHPQVSAIRTKTGNVGGWEPFDTYNAGAISHGDLRFCLDGIFEAQPDFEMINTRYRKTARGILLAAPPGTVRGFKMRFKSPTDWPGLKASAGVRQAQWFTLLSHAIRRLRYRRFRRLMLDCLTVHKPVVFVMVRQDIFRWALSKYHGDGTGRRGHLQFKLAAGKISKDDIEHIRVRPQRLHRIIRRCWQIHGKKRRLLADLEVRGVEAYPLFYEDFVHEPVRFFTELTGHLGIPDAAGVEAMLTKGTTFRKVHADDISTFVLNHEEIMQGFGHIRNPWEESFAYQEAEEEEEEVEGSA